MIKQVETEFEAIELVDSIISRMKNYIDGDNELREFLRTYWIHRIVETFESKA